MEERPKGSSVALRNEYGLSKNAAERIRALWALKNGLPVTVLRLGQVGGVVGSDTDILGTRQWKRAEWLPLLMSTSKSLSAIPSDLPPINLIPVNKLGRIIMEILFHVIDSGRLKIYNIVNPHPVESSSMLDTVRESLREVLIGYF